MISFDPNIVDNLVNFDLPKIIDNISVYKGEGYIKFGDNFDKLKKSEKFKLAIFFRILWVDMFGEFYDKILIKFKDNDGINIDIDDDSLNKYEILWGKKYFKVPYVKKEEFKRYSGKWDNETKLWYIYNSFENKKNVELASNSFKMISV